MAQHRYSMQCYQLGETTISLKIAFKPVCVCVCVCVSSCIVVLKEDFSNIFVRSNSPETLLQGFKSFHVQIWVNDLTTCLPKSLFMHPNNSIHDIACWMGGPKLLLPRKMLDYAIPLTVFFVCRSKWLIHVSSPLTMRDKKLSPSANLNPHLSAQFCNGRLGFVEPKRAHTFENPKTSIMFSHFFWILTA